MNKAAPHHRATLRKVLNALISTLLLAGSSLGHAQGTATRPAGIDQLPSDLIQTRPAPPPRRNSAT